METKISPKKKTAEEPKTEIVITPIRMEVLKIKIRGTAPLICHNWSEKAKREILAKQQRKNTGAKEPKDPKKDYEATLYKTSKGGYGFPAIAFKKAIVRAAKAINGLDMTDARAVIHVIADDGDLVIIKGKPSMREDMVRVKKSADIRYRAEFKEWKATLSIRIDADVISPEQVVNLVNRAGFSAGVGEWRPERDGAFGTFVIEEG